MSLKFSKLQLYNCNCTVKLHLVRWACLLAIFCRGREVETGAFWRVQLLHHPSWLVCRLRRVCCVAMMTTTILLSVLFYSRSAKQLAYLRSMNLVFMDQTLQYEKETNGTLLDTSAHVLAVLAVLARYINLASKKHIENEKPLHPLIPWLHPDLP